LEWRAVLESQLFSGFWIGWMIEHPTISNSKNPKKLDVQSNFSLLQCQKSKKVGFSLDFYWINWIGLDFFSSIQSKNPIPIQQRSKNPFFWIFNTERGLNILIFWIFGVGYGWMFNPKSIQSKIEKKIDFLILLERQKVEEPLC
jgi:hypothetical protein